MTSVGPLPMHAVIVIVAVLLAWLCARIFAKRLPDAPHKAAGAMILDALLWGLLAARLMYIVLWWQEYWAAPKSMIAIGDGGFTWWAGVLVALAYIWWRTMSTKALRLPVITGLIVGVLAWGIAGWVSDTLLRSAPPLQDLQLVSLDNHNVNLNQYVGSPTVINLWASWCPPCRREMPVFERASSEFSDVNFIMINQGESALQAESFLEKEGLSFTDVLLDPKSDAMRLFKSSVMPTTLFFDAQGKQVDVHIGEITMPSLKDKLSKHFY